ncbi:hypothetical protein Fcan01_12365 [Folsomia candida]|uniref:Uncharacterized protein n=1 Tax=Folsomia candida TaxID=158441 RepID=A0A226E3Z7_FOLCA|nr:hypothetical protein Fcan01_12365 [Folsomia candida]
MPCDNSIKNRMIQPIQNDTCIPKGRPCWLYIDRDHCNCWDRTRVIWGGGSFKIDFNVTEGVKRGEKRKSKEIKKDGRRGERVTGEGGEDKAEAEDVSPDIDSLSLFGPVQPNRQNIVTRGPPPAFCKIKMKREGAPSGGGSVEEVKAAFYLLARPIECERAGLVNFINAKPPN